MGKFTLSDALAVGTTGAAVAGSFAKGMRYDPNADKPKLFEPIRRPDVGSPTLERQLADIDRDTASYARMFSEKGSDPGARSLSLLELNRQKMEGKGDVYGEHDKLLVQQRIAGDATINAAEEGNINRINAFETAKQERDIEGATRAQDAAYEAIQSGVDYVGAKNADTRNQEVLKKQADNRITILKADMKQKWLANMTVAMGGYDNALQAWKENEDEFYKPFDDMYSEGYKPEEAFIPDTGDQENSESIKSFESNEILKPEVVGEPNSYSFQKEANVEVPETGPYAENLYPRKFINRLRKYWTDRINN
jgi:hypothetical protein